MSLVRLLNEQKLVMADPGMLLYAAELCEQVHKEGQGIGNNPNVNILRASAIRCYELKRRFGTAIQVAQTYSMPWALKDTYQNL